MAAGHDLDAAQARALFPRGLAQPDWFRFSVDALLLAAFAARWIDRGHQQGLPPRRGLTGLDLGTGCGVAALALLLAYGHPDGGHPDQGDLRMIGVDLAEDMIDCAGKNRVLLGQEDRLEIVPSDVAEYKASAALDFAVCNPPYFQEGSGRRSPEAERRRARFESGGGLDGFLKGAAVNLKNRAPLFMVHQAEGLDRVLTAMSAHGLAPKRILPVHGRADKPASLALVEARLGGGPGVALEPALVLYAEGQALSEQALAFCPQLECNTARGAAHVPE